MARSKSKKIEKPPPLVGKKRQRKPTAKASSALVAPKQPKIKLTTASRPPKEPSPDTGASGANPQRERTIEISSSSSSESPEPEAKTHVVTVNWQVYLNHKLVYSESFQEDFLSILYNGYRFWQGWTDKEIKARRKWKGIYGALSNR
ncbi:uncharacterized protein K444DRAFT_613725 [Hyaloscypha bicolor E]|uniref:Uncharacterized protein n=1 Tax=Hyaloscypha bicolor E TaxID=1095630 RepID=A0A2J6T7C4_9HELO|nr:uncharacterized protein K444DRAFT_613725 [Hyaloscypha bicolor E]PMD58929.1 hypothetical protein K444DRAFT_613725 [Hyaloscypha bicolor E]